MSACGRRVSALDTSGVERVHSYDGIMYLGVPKVDGIARIVEGVRSVLGRVSGGAFLKSSSLTTGDDSVCRTPSKPSSSAIKRPL